MMHWHALEMSYFLIIAIICWFSFSDHWSIALINRWAITAPHTTAWTCRQKSVYYTTSKNVTLQWTVIFVWIVAHWISLHYTWFATFICFFFLFFLAVFYIQHLTFLHHINTSSKLYLGLGLCSRLAMWSWITWHHQTLDLIFISQQSSVAAYSSFPYQQTYSVYISRLDVEMAESRYKKKYLGETISGCLY